MPMKISGSIESRYKKQYDNALAIKNKFSNVIEDWAKSQGWHFEDRLKKIESYAQKIEQSRIKIVEDVYAATIIVKNKIEIKDCCSKLESPTNSIGIRFIRKQPKSFEKTNNDADRFLFDSVRMYFKPRILEVDVAEYVEEIFEIQIKTLLEQAWDKATHATFYKSTDDLSWAKSRLLAQTKALLENAEMVLAETEMLSRATSLQKENHKITQINKMSDFYKSFWDTSVLPKDIKRLSENTLSFLDCIGKNLSWLEDLIAYEKSQDRGPVLINLSPYWIVVQASISKLGWVDFLELLKKCNKLENRKLPLLRELDLAEMNDITESDPVYILK